MPDRDVARREQAVELVHVAVDLDAVAGPPGTGFEEALAEGRTTREAAAALFLSPKTVEYHLRNAYRKLGIRSREEPAAALAGAPGS